MFRKERFAVVEFDADIRENVFADDGDNNFSVVVTLFVPGPKTNKAESGEAGNDKENNEVEEYDYYLKLLSSPDNREIPIKYRDTDVTGDNGEIVPDAETTDISVQQQYGAGVEESQSLKTGNPVAQAIVE